MEYIIKKIANVDKEAEKYKKANKNQLEDFKIKSENEINIMREKFLNELQEQKERLLNTKLKEAYEEVENIKRENKEYCNQIMNSYLKLQDKIVEDIFKELRKAMREG